MLFTEKGSNLLNCKIFLNATGISELCREPAGNILKLLRIFFVLMSFKEMALPFSFNLLNKTMEVTREKI